MSDLILPPNIQEQGKKAVQRNRKSRRTLKKAGLFDNRTASGIIIPDPEPSPEHYHVIYNVVRPEEDEISLPHWKMVFMTATEAYDYIAMLGKAAEPNAEWYDEKDGHPFGGVGIETTMHGRGNKLFWIVLEAAQCVRSSCRPNLSRENLKRSLLVLPGGGKKR